MSFHNINKAVIYDYASDPIVSALSVHDLLILLLLCYGPRDIDDETES